MQNKLITSEKDINLQQLIDKLKKYLDKQLTDNGKPLNFQPRE